MTDYPPIATQKKEKIRLKKFDRNLCIAIDKISSV